MALINWDIDYNPDTQEFHRAELGLDNYEFYNSVINKLLKLHKKYVKYSLSAPILVYKVGYSEYRTPLRYVEYRIELGYDGSTGSPALWVVSKVGNGGKVMAVLPLSVDGVLSNWGFFHFAVLTVLAYEMNGDIKAIDTMLNSFYKVYLNKDTVADLMNGGLLYAE